MFVKLRKKSFADSWFRHDVPVFPYGLFVGNIIDALDVEKLSEAHPVLYLIFYLMVADVVQSLKKKHFQHENRVNRFSSCFAFLVVICEQAFQHTSKLFKINNVF